MKRCAACLFLACLLSACLTSLSFAQAAKAGSIGVLGSLSGSDSVIGATYQLNELMGLRAGLGFDLTFNPDQNPYKLTTVLPLSLKIDCLFELPIASALSLAAGPSLSYTLYGYRYEYPTYTDTETYGYLGIGGTAIVQYLFASDFGAFLDASLTATFLTYRYKTSLSSASTTFGTTDFATATSLGLIFYIN